MRRETRARLKPIFGPTHPPRRSIISEEARSPAFEADPLPAALSSIARIVSRTLELREVFLQVADAARAVLPFETMGVCRLESPDSMRRYAVAGLIHTV